MPRDVPASNASSRLRQSSLPLDIADIACDAERGHSSNGALSTNHDADLVYHAARAQQEVVCAIVTGSTITAWVHPVMCLLHCGRVIAELLFSRRRRAED